MRSFCVSRKSKISVNLFGCAGARNKCMGSNRTDIRRNVLKALVLSGLINRLMGPDLFKTFADEFMREVNLLRMGGSDDPLGVEDRKFAGGDGRWREACRTN